QVRSALHVAEVELTCSFIRFVLFGLALPLGELSALGLEEPLTLVSFVVTLCLDRACTFCWTTRRPGHGERENHIHRDHEAAEGQHGYGDIRPGEIARSDGQADTNVAHAATDSQDLAI